MEAPKTPKPTEPKSPQIIAQNEETVSPPPATPEPQPVEIQVLGEETASLTTTSVEKKSLQAFIQRALTSPRHSLTYLYGAIMALILLALALVIFIKHEVRHPAIILRGVALIAIILSLLFVDSRILRIDGDVPTNDASANVIEAFAPTP
jgi:hypothetical protein